RASSTIFFLLSKYASMFILLVPPVVIKVPAPVRRFPSPVKVTGVAPPLTTSGGNNWLSGWLLRTGLALPQDSAPPVPGAAQWFPSAARLLHRLSFRGYPAPQSFTPTTRQSKRPSLSFTSSSCPTVTWRLLVITRPP